MIKGISSINGFIKTSVISALLASSTALYASNPTKVTNNISNKTEVVSKAGADALKAMSIQDVKEVNQASVPTVRNTKLDAAMKKYAQNEEEKLAIDNWSDNIHDNYGTFLGSAFVQHEIDRHQLVIFLRSDADILIKKNINPALGRQIKGYGDAFFASIKPCKEDMLKWLSESYTPTINQLLLTDCPLNADDVIKRLDYIAANKTGFNSKELTKYNVYCDDFKERYNKNKSDIQAKSDLIAFKMYMIDSMIMKKTLKNSGAFGLNSFYLPKEKIGMSDFFDKWMESAEPKVN